MKLFDFLQLSPHEQRSYISGLVEIGRSTNDDEWRNAPASPVKPGYYPVIQQYGKFEHTKRIGAARWNGFAWADCYDNEHTTGGRYTAWNVLAWADNKEG